MERTNLCPICGGGSIRAYVEAVANAVDSSSLGSSRIAVSHGTILRCRSCGFGFLESRLTESQLAELYRNLDHQIYESEADGRARTAKQHFKIVNRVVRPGNLLDVGCASGGFLQVCLRNGFQVTGVEPAKVFAGRAKSALQGKGEVFCATLQEASLKASSFDAITLWDVLEHVADPVDFLRKCGSLLKPGGYLFVNVPDIGSIQAKLLGRRWPLLLPEHFNYFTRRSLDLCARKAGLTLLGFGRRPAFFSVGYVLYRLAQHNILGMRLGKQVAAGLGLDHLIFPILLGEIYGVWRRAVTTSVL